MTLTDKLYETLHKGPIPLKQIAEEIGMSVSYLTRSALPDQEDSETGVGCRFPLKKLIPLVKSTGDYRVIDYIENSLGRVAVPLPKVTGSPADICRLTMASVKEYGHLMSEVESSMADGKITKEECERVSAEGYEAVQAIMSLIGQVKKLAR